MYKSIDINNPDDIERYYKQLFAFAKDKENLTDAIEQRDFEAVDREYRLIPDSGEKLIVPYEPMLSEYDRIRSEIFNTGITPTLMKDAAPITVTVFKNDKLEKYAEQVMFREKGHAGKNPSGYWLLRPQYEQLYTKDSGLKLPGKNIDKSGFTY